MFLIVGVIGFYLIGLTTLAKISLAAFCFTSPTFQYDAPIFTDVQNVRSTLCTKGSPGFSCEDAFGDTIICYAQSGNAYAAMAGTTGAAGLDDMYNYCEVC
jgi:hypothetical protein